MKSDAKHKPTLFRKRTGVLASSPENFLHSGNIENYEFFRRAPYSMTNKGLSMNILIPGTPLEFEKASLLQPFKTLLNCREVGGKFRLSLTMPASQKNNYSRHYQSNTNLLYEYVIEKGVNWLKDFHFAPVHLQPSSMHQSLYKRTQEMEISFCTESIESYGFSFQDGVWGFDGEFDTHLNELFSSLLSFQKSKKERRKVLGGERTPGLLPGEGIALRFTHSSKDTSFIVILTRYENELGSKIVLPPQNL